MPGFLIFNELGLDDKFENMPDLKKAAIKSAIAMMPGSWMKHGLGGEYNVDVDPVAEVNKLLDGGGAVGSIAGNAQGAAESAASGDVAGVASNAASALGTFWEAYKGWIPVVNVSQSFNSEAEEKDSSAAEETRIARKAAGMASGQTQVQLQAQGKKIIEQVKEGVPDNNIDELETVAPTSSGQNFPTKMSGEVSGVERISVEVHLDVSFPRLMKAALKPDGDKQGPKVFKSADIHLCTVASVDTRQLTMGSDSPAAQLVQTLIGFFMFNVVPYVTISMEDVQVAEVSYNLQGDSSGATPTATVILEYKKVTWSYHVINGSNMNLLTVDFGYDVQKHEAIDASAGGAKLGSALNPFA